MADLSGANGLASSVYQLSAATTPSRQAPARPSGSDTLVVSEQSTTPLTEAAAATLSSAEDRVSLSSEARSAFARDAGAGRRNLSDLFGALRRFLRPATQRGTSEPPRAAAWGLNNTPQVQRLMASIQDRLEDIAEGDDKTRQQLDLLLRTLEEMGIEVRDTTDFLTEFERVMDRLAKFASGDLMETLAAVSQAAGRPGAANAGGGPPRQQQVSFVFEMEVTQTTSMEARLAELREQGVDVQQIRVDQTSTFKLRIEFTGVREAPRQAEPLVLDLDGDGVRMTGFEEGVTFDIDADGVADQTAFVAGGDGALAMDRNGNGTIDDGGELFGDQHGAANGFAELARFDDNADQVIDRRDSVWTSLGALRDANRDGKLDPGEFVSLDALGVGSISLVNRLLKQDDGKGNCLAERGTFNWLDGRQGQAVDVWFGYHPGQRLDQMA